MHTYHVDKELRTRVFIVSGILSIFSAYLFHFFTQQLPFDIPWWFDTPAVLGFFSMFVWLYDNHFWRYSPFRRLKWFYIPNLNGLWKVKIVSSYKGFEDYIQATVRIRQTASKISIALQTNESSSHSIFAALICIERFNTYELVYHYVNRPKADAVETMSIHNGTCWLEVADNIGCLEGVYYSGRGRQHFGTIAFVRQET
ncbi:MAG: hypothetical protein GY797_09740 [Deltaproteobacteria bacterium]|nr:hypothetical protein [Deltaproteobacteria bacterium]